MSTPFSAAVLWSQFILAAALELTGKSYLEAAADTPFCYIDTHAGGGLVAPPNPHLVRFQANPTLARSALGRTLGITKDGYPGSWLLAARVLGRVGVDFEIDINDLSSEALEQARQNQQIGRIRYWSHDWFRFLRTRLSAARPPHFIFIDPPTDARGLAYAMDAAILLDTLRVPYMITYQIAAAQDIINDIGRTGLELTWSGNKFCTGALLGGGAEASTLGLLPDLGLLAQCLEGQFAIRTPTNDDFTI